ncbi:GTPase [Helicobacter pylori]|nr:GTPase [Helicobacter pylori]
MKNIYLDVKASIENLQNIFKNTDNENERLKKSNQEALKVFQKLESESLKELESLKNNEEWENFTIAFYGETGAGKSTIIEYLRLFFKERSKMDQQERFKRLYLDYQEKYKDDKSIIEQYDTEISDFQKTLQDLENELISLKECNIFFKIFHFLTGNRKFKEISKCFQKSQDELNNIELKKENHISEKQAILNELHSLQDGAIIGDGRSDFTLKTQSYSFQLGEHYMGYKAVSAQAAFYGLSQALILGTDFDEKKQKFLEIFKVEELLLYKSHFKPLVEFIAEELLKNSRAKIIQSNCNKALKVVEELQNTIEITIEKQIDPMIKDMQEHQQEDRFNLDRSKEKFISDLENSALDEIDQFKFGIGEIMEERIEKGVEDEECKEIFDNELKQRETKLIEDIERRFKECEEQFRGSVGKNIEQLEERVQDSLAIVERINNLSLNPNADFNMDSGIDTIGLLASIGGLVLLFLTPVVGEFALIAGVGLALVGIGKAVWGFFDSDHKKSQQKKEVDKNLHQICEKITEDVKSRLESRKKDIREKIKKLKADLNEPVENYEYKKERLKEADKRLGYISNDIKTRSMQ